LAEYLVKVVGLRGRGCVGRWAPRPRCIAVPPSYFWLILCNQTRCYSPFVGFRDIEVYHTQKATLCYSLSCKLEVNIPVSASSHIGATIAQRVGVFGWRHRETGLSIQNWRFPPGINHNIRMAGWDRAKTGPW